MPSGLQNELIRASAGTGKTHQLTNRYLRLLRLGHRPDEILATTFTRKAAGEILDRVLMRLAQAALDPVANKQLTIALKDPALQQPECLELLVQLCRQLHRLRIGTLDSFFAQLAGSFALELGLPPGWRISEEHADAVLRARAVDAVLSADSTQELLTLVHALTQGETTRSLQREIHDKVNSFYSVFRESEKPAWHRLPRARQIDDAQIAQAVDGLKSLPLPGHKSWHKAHARDIVSAETNDWAEFVGGGLAGKVAAGANTYFGLPIDPVVAGAYQLLIDHAKAVLINRLADQTAATYRLLEKFHAAYERLKSQTRWLRFDDISFRLAEAVHSFDEDNLQLRLDGNLEHLLLDEFQDTSLTQWVVLRPLATRVSGGPPLPPAGPLFANFPEYETDHDSSFFCVGDAKQAIYGWRGGIAEIIDSAREELGVVERSLRTNWRSAPQIIEAVNQVFAGLNRHDNLGNLADGVAAWQRQFETHLAAPANADKRGYVTLRAARLPASDENDLQKTVTLRFVAEQAAHHRSQSPDRDLCILVRRNEAVRRLIFELRELGIEASEEGGSLLDDSAAVRLVLSLIQLADHPGDLVARFHLGSAPWGRLLGLSPETAVVADDAQAGQLARRVRSLLMDQGYGPTVYQWARQLSQWANARELRRLEKLIGLAYQYDPLATTRPADFVSYVNSQKVRDPLSSAVRVMTVHQAKGLEFDIVLLADLEADLIGQRSDLVVGRPAPTAPVDRVTRRCGKEIRQLLPDSWQPLFQSADDQDLAESLCVMYVALTRAKFAMHIIVQPSAKNERSLHKTFGGLLRASLTDGKRIEPDELAYEHGFSDWYLDADRQGGSPAGQPQAEVANQQATVAVELAEASGPRHRGLERVSPSGMEGGRHVRLSDTTGGDGTQRRTALERGTLVHGWFEQIEWIDDGRPNHNLLRKIARDIPDIDLSAEQIEQFVIEFDAMLDHPPVAQCLQRERVRAALLDNAGVADGRLQVSCEHPIAVRQDDQLLVGNVDRLVTLEQDGKTLAAEIIDYKTDRVAGNNSKGLRDKVEYYRPQVMAYRRAIGRIFALDERRIIAKLVFVEPAIVCEIS